MVNFQLDEMQEMLRELAHEFAVDEIRPNAEHWDLNSEYPKDVINAAHEMGRRRRRRRRRRRGRGRRRGLGPGRG